MLTIKSLGLKADSNLIKAIALTFAMDVLDVYEKIYSGDLKPRMAVTYSLAVSLKDPYSEIIKSWIGYDINEVCSNKIRGDQEAYQAARVILNTFYTTTYPNDPISYIAELEELTQAAAIAKRCNTEQYTHDILLSVFPFVLEYKMENQEQFGDLEVIWDYLTQEQKDLIIFNLDILANRLREI